MSFLRKFFSRDNIPDRVFEMSTNVVTDSVRFSTIVQDAVNRLTESERASIIRICIILDEHINWHRTYLVLSKDTPLQSGKNYNFWLQSYFEFMVLNWVIIVNHFEKYSVRAETGNVLYYILKDTFSYYENLFTSSPFKTFDNAFQQRQAVHSKLLTNYFSLREDKIEAYQNLSEMLIGNPLSYVASDDDDMVLASFSYGREPHEQAGTVLDFNSHFLKGSTKFMKQLAAIDFRS